MRTHRVGTVTLGSILVIFGTLLLLHLLLPVLSYEFIFRLWPAMLIILGIEVLAANVRSEKVKFVYDKGAVFLMILLSLFALFMSAVDYGLQNSQVTWRW